MTRVTLDQAVISQLLQPIGSVEVCDQHGTIVGVFNPKPPTFDLSKEVGLSEDEVKRRLKQPGRPLAEMLRDLEKVN